jgi:hypothetical protein
LTILLGGSGNGIPVNFSDVLLLFFLYVLQQAAVVDDVEGEVGQRIEANFRAGGFILDDTVFVVDLQPAASTVHLTELMPSQFQYTEPLSTILGLVNAEAEIRTQSLRR